MAALRAKHEEADAREAEAAARLDAEFRALLPFLGDDIFVLIAAELDARMLGRLGCAAQRFWWASVPDPAHTAQDPGGAELWSVAEEGARRRLAAQSEQVRGWGARGGAGGSWLRALGEAEKLRRPLRFTTHHETSELGEEGTVVTKDSYGGWNGAVCGGHEMRRGRHYATFTLHTLGYGAAMLGGVGVGFDPTTGDEANMSPQGWMLYTGSGCLCTAGASDSKWEGQPGKWELKEGDVVVRPTPLCLSHGVARAAAMGGRDGLDLDAAMVGDHRRPVATARLGRREKEDCLFTAELCPHRQRASRAKPL